jgi:hypothetical protein
VFENRVLWRIFGVWRDEVTGGWRALGNEQLHQFKEDDTGRACSTNGDEWNAYSILVGETTRKTRT